MGFNRGVGLAIGDFGARPGAGAGSEAQENLDAGQNRRAAFRLRLRDLPQDVRRAWPKLAAFSGLPGFLREHYTASREIGGRGRRLSGIDRQSAAGAGRARRQPSAAPRATTRPSRTTRKPGEAQTRRTGKPRGQPSAKVRRSQIRRRQAGETPRPAEAKPAEAKPATPRPSRQPSSDSQSPKARPGRSRRSRQQSQTSSPRAVLVSLSAVWRLFFLLLASAGFFSSSAASRRARRSASAVLVAFAQRLGRFRLEEGFGGFGQRGRGFFLGLGRGAR